MTNILDTESRSTDMSIETTIDLELTNESVLLTIMSTSSQKTANSQSPSSSRGTGRPIDTGCSVIITTLALQSYHRRPDVAVGRSIMSTLHQLDTEVVGLDSVIHSLSIRVETTQPDGVPCHLYDTVIGHEISLPLRRQHDNHRA